MLSPSPAEDDVETLLAQSSAARAFGPQPSSAARPAAGPAVSAGCAAGGGGGRGRWGQRLTLAPQRSAWGRKATDPLADEDAAPEKVLSGGILQCACTFLHRCYLHPAAGTATRLQHTCICFEHYKNLKTTGHGLSALPHFKCRFLP